jgi:response regulator RpfG family c-di-GMP phosphodiesterase
MEKILLVDDEPNVLAALQRGLRKQFAVDIAASGATGLLALENSHDYAVVVADMQMPEMNGVEFLAKVKDLSPDVVRVMLTGNADQKTAIEAINEGAIFRFLNKPCTAEKLAEVLAAGVRQHQLITAERDLLENTLRGSIKALTEILAMADSKAFGDAERLRNNVLLLAEAMQVPNLWELEVAAMLSQIGCVTIPPETLLKARQGGPLSAKEMEMFRHVPAVGAEVLARIPRMEGVARILGLMRKNYDGTGGPDETVAGDAIPLGARLLKVLGDLGELEAGGKSHQAALSELQKREGWYDPGILTLVCSPEQSAALQRAASSRPCVPLGFAQLRVGHVLRADVETRDGVLIVIAGNRITPALLARLRNFCALSGVKEPIYVEA